MAEIFPHEFNIVPHIVALLIAYLLALPIGWDREKNERSAGLRTFPLVAMASCALIQATERMMAEDVEAMGRIIEGIIAGVGFIGGGAILRLKTSVKGTATAASLWATAAIGVAAGIGSYDVALGVAILTVATLWILSPVKKQIEPEAEATEKA